MSEFSIDERRRLRVGADGGSELLEIKGNVKWQGTSESSWLKFSPSNGEGAATCEVLVDSSVVAEPRVRSYHFYGSRPDHCNYSESNADGVCKRYFCK